MSEQAQVVCLLVSHDGASWLPNVLDGLQAQTAPVDAVIAVDTGSRDGSADLIEQRLTGQVPFELRRRPAETSFPAAIADGLLRARWPGRFEVRRRFGVAEGNAGVVLTRTGRPFFSDAKLEAEGKGDSPGGITPPRAASAPSR